jgi:hypothetical protein
MDGECAMQEATERSEPISITLADLSALVFGSALAISLPRMHLLTDRITIGNIPMPGWVAWLFVIGEAAMRVGLAFIPVILARRARYGGLPRPAEWLSILVALALLQEVIQRSGWIEALARWYIVDLRSSLGYAVSFPVHETVPGGRITVADGYDGLPAGFTAGDAYRLWGWFATVLLLVVSAALGFGRKRMPGWAKTGLLSVAALTSLAAASYLLTPGLGRLSQAASKWVGLPSSIIVQIAVRVGTIPEGLLFGVPVVAIFIELRMGGKGKWVWTEWIGAATGLLALLTGVIIYGYADLVNRTDPLASTRLTVQILRLVVVGLSGWVIVKHFGRAGTRSGSRA